jgi:hypothetical protein
LHTTVVVLPGGTTTVVLAGGGGLELLMHPANIPVAIIALSNIFIVGLLCFNRYVDSDRRQSARAPANPASGCRLRAYIQ